MIRLAFPAWRERECREAHGLRESDERNNGINFTRVATGRIVGRIPTTTH